MWGRGKRRGRRRHSCGLRICVGSRSGAAPSLGRKRAPDGGARSIRGRTAVIQSTGVSSEGRPGGRRGPGRRPVHRINETRPGDGRPDGLPRHIRYPGCNGSTTKLPLGEESGTGTPQEPETPQKDRSLTGDPRDDDPPKPSSGRGDANGLACILTDGSGGHELGGLAVQHADGPPSRAAIRRREGFAGCLWPLHFDVGRLERAITASDL